LLKTPKYIPAESLVYNLCLIDLRQVFITKVLFDAGDRILDLSFIFAPKMIQSPSLGSYECEPKQAIALDCKAFPVTPSEDNPPVDLVGKIKFGMWEETG
jgi:hypothetical protein